MKAVSHLVPFRVAIERDPAPAPKTSSTRAPLRAAAPTWLTHGVIQWDQAHCIGHAMEPNKVLSFVRTPLTLQQGQSLLCQHQVYMTKKHLSQLKDLEAISDADEAG